MEFTKFVGAQLSYPFHPSMQSATVKVLPGEEKMVKVKLGAPWALAYKFNFKLYQ